MVDHNAGWVGDRDRLAEVAAARPLGVREAEERSDSLGSRISLPGESVAEVDRRVAGLERALAPRGEMARILVRRIAVCSVRLDRAVDHEAAMLAQRVRRAEADFDEARLTEADHLLGWISSEPATHYRRLLRSPEGVDRLVATLRGLRQDLDWTTSAPWDHGHHASILDECTGRRSSVLPASRGWILSEAIGGDFRRLGPSDGVGLPDLERRAWAREALGRLIELEIDRLVAHRAKLDHHAIAADRGGSPQRAAFNPEQAAILARRYEAATERSMMRALAEVRVVNAEAEQRGIEPARSEPLIAAFHAQGGRPRSPPVGFVPRPVRGPAGSSPPASGTAHGSGPCGDRAPEAAVPERPGWVRSASGGRVGDGPG